MHPQAFHPLLGHSGHELKKHLSSGTEINFLGAGSHPELRRALGLTHEESMPEPNSDYKLQTACNSNKREELIDPMEPLNN